MEIKSVIIRKPISESDHILGLLILGTVDAKRMETIKTQKMIYHLCYGQLDKWIKQQNTLAFLIVKI